MVESISIPPAARVRDQLAAAQAEVRYLRRILRIAKEKDEANRLRGKVANEEATPCK
jgi:hypothetical protein